MISKGNHVKFAPLVLLADFYILTPFVIYYQFHLLSWPYIFFRFMCNKTIRFGFGDTQKNQGLSYLTTYYIENNPFWRVIHF